jgi:hypothetical protein
MRALFLGLFVSLLMLAGCSSSSSDDSSGVSAPVITGTDVKVDENASIGSVVGTITIVDDGGSAITAIALGGTGAGDFNVGNGGTITVANTLDYETKSEYNLTAVATNSAGNSAPVNVNIAVVDDTNESVPVLQDLKADANESMAIGTVIGDILVTPGDFPVTSIDLSGTGAGDFSVATDGKVSVAADLNYTKQNTYALTAVATSAAGDSDPVDVNITVMNPPTLQPFSMTIANGIVSGTVIGDINISDYGENDITSIELIGTGGTDFSVETDDGNISANVDIDFYSQGLYRLQAVAHSTAGDSAPVPVTILVDVKFEGAAAYDYTGSSVAVSGDFVVVGAEGNASKPGSAIVYKIDSDILSATYGQYVKLDTLTAGDGAAGDKFGISVAMDGDYIVVGAQMADLAPDQNDSGAAYVFKYDDGGLLGSEGFGQVAKLTAGDHAAHDHFGFSVAVYSEAVDTGLIVVGADNKNSESGAAYVYSISAGYTQQAEMTGTVSTNFGWSVGVSGTNVVVGAPYADTGAGDTGSVFLFSSDGTPLHELTATDAQANDHLGWSVAIDGTNIVAGAESQDHGDTNASANYGAAYVFATDGSQVAKLVSDTPELGGRFGMAIDISGDSVIVGAEREDPAHDLTGNFGYAYLFENVSGTFSQVARFNNHDAHAGDLFGSSVGIDGSNAAAGAPIETGPGDASGSLYLFNFAP